MRPADGHGRVRTRETPLASDLDLRVPHQRAGSTAAQEPPSRSPTASTYVGWPIERGLDVDGSRPLSSSSTRTWTSSRRSPSTGRRAASGRGRSRALRREEPVVADVLPHADGRRFVTAQQPEVNIVRTADRGARCGARRHRVAAHEQLCDGSALLPTEDAVRIALRTQQVIAHETGVESLIDPLGGSYHVESLYQRARAPGVRLLRADRAARRRRRRDQENSSKRRSPRHRSGTRPRSKRTSGSWSASTVTSSTPSSRSKS